jgi:hypothetical protein
MAFARTALTVTALIASVPLAAAPQDPYGKIADERAVTMLKLVRQRLTEQGLADAHEAIGLEFGYYAGCRTLMLEHRFVDGCLGFRANEEMREQAGPERIRQIVEDICRTEACPYRGRFAFTIRFFRETLLPARPDGSHGAINTQVGDRFHYWITVVRQ